ncbi:MAG: hypothetical protein U1E59_14075 [Amaricoccus sp.]
MAAGDGDQPGGSGPRSPADAESLAEVLASIRALVSAETAARAGGGPGGGTVLMLTPEMRRDRPHRGVALAEGLGAGMSGSAAPILDEESLRELINGIVREELQGELGDRINRNLRKLIRREITQILEEQRKEP